MAEPYQDDIDKILALRNVNGADFWASPEGNIAYGGPFSTLESCLILAELGCDPELPELRGAARLIFENISEDGRIRTAPRGATYAYVLSFYDRAKSDLRFLDVLELLKSKLVEGKVLVESTHRKLRDFAFCRQGEPSLLATKRYREILDNFEK